MLVPLNFYASEEDGINRLLVEYLAICYLIEDMPIVDTIDYGSEVLRRALSWIIQQDKGLEGYLTPHGRQIHFGMGKISDLYLMAISFPWGYKKQGNKKYSLSDSLILLVEPAIHNYLGATFTTPLEWIDNLSDWRWVSRTNEIFAPNPNLWWSDPNQWLPEKFRDAIRNEENKHSVEIHDTIANHLLDKDNAVPLSMRKYKHEYLMPIDVDRVNITI